MNNKEKVSSSDVDMKHHCVLCSRMAHHNVTYEDVDELVGLLDCSARGKSETLYCMDCERCLLYLPELKHFIPLRHFHVTRGDLMRAAFALYIHLCFDSPLPQASIATYGVATKEHYHALKALAFNNDFDAQYVLDRVMGDGAAITRLVAAAPNQPHREIEFTTPYDSLPIADDGRGLYVPEGVELTGDVVVRRMPELRATEADWTPWSIRRWCKDTRNVDSSPK